MRNSEFQRPRIIKESPLTAEQLSQIDALRSRVMKCFPGIVDIFFSRIVAGEIMVCVKNGMQDGFMQTTEFSLDDLVDACLVEESIKISAGSINSFLKSPEARELSPWTLFDIERNRIAAALKPAE